MQQHRLVELLTRTFENVSGCHVSVRTRIHFLTTSASQHALLTLTYLPLTAVLASLFLLRSEHDSSSAQRTAAAVAPGLVLFFSRVYNATTKTETFKRTTSISIFNFQISNYFTQHISSQHFHRKLIFPFTRLIADSRERKRERERRPRERITSCKFRYEQCPHHVSRGRAVWAACCLIASLPSIYIRVRVQIALPINLDPCQNKS